MSLIKNSITIFSIILFSSCNNTTKKDFISHCVDVAEQQYSMMESELTDTKGYPRTLRPDGKLKVTPKNDWTEGFYPGALWYLYELSEKQEWYDAAMKWTLPLEELKTLTWHHDIGFLMYCSFGNAYRITKNEQYKAILVESANSLCTRYNDTTQVIKSWNYRKSWNGVDEWFYPVIIDNMMNLELLYFASEVTGDTFYAKVATQHAETTAKYQLRDDYSTYHVINYDPITGEALHKTTMQGFSDNSTWARGQAWCIYGYTLAYRKTKKPQFLEIAEKAADWWLQNQNLPEDMVPFWDFNAGQKGYTADWNYNPDLFNPQPRDASAAAITASALLELSKYSNNRKKYFRAAENTLKSLASDNYLASEGGNGNFILKHSVGSIPHGAEIDVPLIYADYYFLEALLRYRNYNNID